MPLTKVTSGVRTLGTGEVATANMAVDPTNASNLSSGSVPTAQLGNVDTAGLEDDIALLGFKVASNGSLAKYDLVDQTVDDFQSEAGIDTSASTNEAYDSTGKYYSGASYGSYTYSAHGTGSGQGSQETSTWTCPANVLTVEMLAVGGGAGGGGYYYAGGGGAGGIVHDEDYAVTAGVVYDISVGIGGTEGSYNGGQVGFSGGDTTWNVNAEGGGIAMVAKGGGGGGSYGSGITNGIAGGSGGGAGAYAGSGTGGSSTQTSPTGAVGYGNAGASNTSSTDAGQGGGGAGGAGVASVSSNTAGAGGVGKLFSNFTAYGMTSSNTASTGSDGGWFGGGGGGGSYSEQTGGAGGVGGGGRGANGNANQSGVGGTAGTGGGGGGAAHYSSGGRGAGSGGQGKLLLRYRTTAFNNMTLISNATTAESTPTKGDMVMTYTDGAGTNVINTDIKAYVSRDNGTTYTQGTLVDQGTSGGHTILSFHDLDISSQPSGTAMRYKIETLNQSAAKYANIQAVSLGWS